ncbi:hypothetical protein GGF49_002729 [Coemansia sp. RSA 1853]|nr:hypothetical protein GGF49_002729 [Coemansia sp. RSA 1853]
MVLQNAAGGNNVVCKNMCVQIDGVTPISAIVIGTCEGCGPNGVFLQEGAVQAITGNKGATFIDDATWQLLQVTGPIDPNALVSPDDPRVNQNATVVGKKDPTLPDYKDSGITFNGMIGQYNVNNDACLSKSTDNDLVAALNKIQYEELVDKNNNPVRCQECILIHGDKGDVEVTIVDECPQCENNMLNLSPAAYALATSQASSATITWEFVLCSAESFSKTRPDKNGGTAKSSD